MLRSFLLVLVSLSCSYSFAQDMTDDPCITFQLTEIQGQPGDTVCSDLQVIDFVDVLSFQFSVKYNEAVLTYVGCFDDELIPSFRCNDVNLQDDGPVLKALWFEPLGNLTTLDSAAVIMSLCFILSEEAISDLTYLEFSDDLASEVSVGDPNDLSVANRLQFCPTADITSNTSNISQNLALTIFPNPVADVLFLENADIHVMVKQISIYNTNGQLMLKESQQSHLNQIRLDHLHKGYYFIRIDMNDDTSYSSRFYKE